MHSPTALALTALLLPSIAQAQGGRVVLSSDDWTLSNTGIAVAPDAATFAQNVGSWFSGGGPGTFLAYSSNFGLTGTSLASAMTSAGHQWTVSMSSPFDLGTLLAYDGVFVLGNPLDTSILQNYVAAGGNVYVGAGSGAFGSAAAEAAHWNPFLAGFGLAYEPSFGTGTGLRSTISSHPIFSGVLEIYQKDGNAILDLGTHSGGEVLVMDGSNGLYAVFDSTVCGFEDYCVAAPNSAGTGARISAQGSTSIAANDLSLSVTGASLGQPALFFYGAQAIEAPFGNGVRCVGGLTVRLSILNTGPGGTPSLTLDLQNGPLASGLVTAQPGSNLFFQLWYRDPAAGGAAFNLSDGLAVAFCP